MAEREVLEQLTKLRLKVIQQKLAAERNSSSNVQFSALGPAGAGVLQTGTCDVHPLLQAEVLKNEQLLEKVKEERHAHKRKSKGQSPSSEAFGMEMMSLMMSQNVQLQQLMLSQMVKSSAEPATNRSETLPQDPSSTFPRLVEIQQVSHREMTPFSTLPNTKPVNKEEPKPVPKPQPKPQIARLPSPQAALPRGIATPVRPTELMAEIQHKKPTPRVEGFLSHPSSHDPNTNSYPFPGTRRIKKLRHVFYASWFCFILIALLKKVVQRRLREIERLDEMIHLAILETHKRYYLDQDNSTWNSLYDLVKEGCFDLKVKSPGVFQRLSQEQQATLTELSIIVETIIYNITEIRPGSGLLSSTRDGVLWYMMQHGTSLPATYLWQVEKDMINITDRGTVGELDKQTSVMMVLGLFVSRGLVSSLILKPMDSGLCPFTPSNVAHSNLKVLGSIVMRIVREVSVQIKKKPMPLAAEISSQLYSDDEMKFISKKLESTFIWSKANLRKWAEAYVDTVNNS